MHGVYRGQREDMYMGDGTGEEREGKEEALGKIGKGGRREVEGEEAGVRFQTDKQTIMKRITRRYGEKKERQEKNAT